MLSPTHNDPKDTSVPIACQFLVEVPRSWWSGRVGWSRLEFSAQPTGIPPNFPHNSLGTLRSELHTSVWVGSRLRPGRVWRRQGTALCPAGPGEALARDSRDFLVVPAAGLRSRTLTILESGQRRFPCLCSGRACPGSPGAHPVCPTRMAHLLGRPMGAFLHQRASSISEAMQ